MGDIIVITLLAIIIGLIIFSSIKNKNKNKSGCAGCSKCRNAQDKSCCSNCNYNR